MKKKLFCKWLALFAILLSVNMQAQMTVGGKKEPEAFSVLELLNKGGLRLPQMTTAERNAFAVKNNDKGNGLTIYNKTTNCVEYWNAVRWVSLCEGTSQTTLSPQPCTNIATDGSGCDQTFSITDPDCPNGPFAITIVAGSEYASLYNVDTANGKFQISFRENASVYTRSVLVRVTSICNNSYKDFLYSQNAVDCSSMSYAVPTVSPANSALTLCTGGAVYLSVPPTTANLDKLIWTRNGIEVARGTNYYMATQKGEYNVSMGAIGCNTNTANKRTITESGTATAVNLSALASNNGILCGTNSVTLSATGSTGSIVWFHNGVEEKSGAKVSVSGDSSIGEWFAAVKDGSCYSKPSNSINVSKSTTASGQVFFTIGNVLVNGQAITNFNSFCAGGALDLSVNFKEDNTTYTWYNGTELITSNPFIVPSSQSTLTLRVIATDNTGAKCPNEQSVVGVNITSGNTPAQPNITGNAVLCDGTTDLTIVPAVAGSYTYNWYKDGVKMAANTPTITVTTPGVVYTASVSSASGCSSSLATKTIAANVSSLPILTWASKPATAIYGATITVQTAIEFGPAASYNWTVDNGATIVGSGASVSIKLPASGTDSTPLNIKVSAVNTCGTSVELTGAITMNSACPTPTLTAQAATSQNVTQGSSVVVAVSVTNGVSPTYQWYKNTTASTTGGTVISGATTASYNYTPSASGTSYLYCIVTNGCAGNLKATSGVFTVVTDINPATLPTGSGTLSGRTCFDIGESNDNTSCGTLISRASSKADFNLTTTNTQTYTFTPSGTVSNVRFKYVESLPGQIVQSLTTSGNTATIIYKTTLSSGSGTQGTAKGKDSQSALSVAIYAVYFNGSTDVQVQLKAQIKDCSCCGAMISPTVWKVFMCHNLGANQNLDPFTANPGLYGNYYAWGNDNSALGQSMNINGWKDGVGPCPNGYRLPTVNEWIGVLDNNKRTQVTNGVFFGPLLFMPMVGTYQDKWPVNHNSNLGTDGGYWVNEGIKTSIYGQYATYIQIAGGAAVAYTGDTIQTPIRCISKD